MTMNGYTHEEGLALQLLRSSDSKIAAAAKRIFSISPTPPPTTTTSNDIANDINSSSSIIPNMINESMGSIAFSLGSNNGGSQDSNNRNNRTILNLLAAAAMQPPQIISSSSNTMNNNIYQNGQLSNMYIDSEHSLCQQQNKQNPSIVENEQRIEHNYLASSLLLSRLSQGSTSLPAKRTGSLPPKKKTVRMNSFRQEHDQKTSEKMNVTFGKQTINAKGEESPKSAVSNEKLLRRERNRIHARRTRQRKKEHLQNLQEKAEKLREEQIQLRLQINEKNTANILLIMCNKTNENECDGSAVDPEVDKLLQRSTDDIPSSSKISELPALVLPGCHGNKKYRRKDDCGDSNGEIKQLDEIPQHEKDFLDGIDYSLLCKDRSTCTPAELEKIRRERNRMHAKRTRDRKRIFMEDMEKLISQLQNENKTLCGYLESLGGSSRSESFDASSDSKTTGEDMTPDCVESSSSISDTPLQGGSMMDTTSLKASNLIKTCELSHIPDSPSNSKSESVETRSTEDDRLQYSCDLRQSKRQKISNDMAVPSTIFTKQQSLTT